MKRLYLFLLVFLPLVHVVGQDTTKIKNHTEWYAGIHFAGNTGLLSFNSGLSLLNDRLFFGAGYGYLPKSINGVEVHSILFKTSFCFSRGLLYRKADWYIGCNTIYGITDNTFLKLPAYYPDGYYVQNAIHWAPFVGLKLPFNFYKPSWAKGSNLHVELGTLDSYVWYKIKNKHVEFWDICNLSAGLSFDF